MGEVRCLDGCARQHKKNVNEFEVCLKFITARFKAIPFRDNIIGEHQMSNQFGENAIEDHEISSSHVEVDPKFSLDCTESF